MNHSTSDAYMIEGRDKMIDEYEELFHSARQMREAQARYRQAQDRVNAVKQLTQDAAYPIWSDEYDSHTKHRRNGNENE